MVESFTYSIRDLEALSGIPAHTIRTWERRYGIFTPARDAVNARCYTASDISYLNQLVSLLRQGHRISTLAGKSRDEIASLAKESALGSSESDFTEALCMTLQEFDAVKLENMMTCYIRKEGFDAAMTGRFIPFLDRISFMLLTGVLKPLHIQLFYAALRLKVQAACEVVTPNRDGQRWMLIHDEELTDTIYRDVMQYLLKKAGRQVIILGALNAEMLKNHQDEIKADGFCLVAGSERTEEWVQEMLNAAKVDQGYTLVVIPGETLEFSNISQNNRSVILTGMQEAFSLLIGI